MCYVEICKAATFVQPTDDCVLRHIATDIEDELQEKIWDLTRQPTVDAAASASLGYVINQQTLATDYLLARLRLDPTHTLQNLVPSVVDDSVPITFKLALVRACLAIIRDENNLPWNPTINSMYGSLCTPLRKLFLQAVSAELPTTVRDLASSSTTLTSFAKKTILPDINPGMKEYQHSRIELLRGLLRLFRADPLLALQVSILETIMQWSQRIFFPNIRCTGQ